MSGSTVAVGAPVQVGPLFSRSTLPGVKSREISVK